MCIVSGDGTARERNAAAAADEVAARGGSLHEVWLLDTGIFVIVDEVPAAWRKDATYMLGLRQRRTLRMLLPSREISNLPRVATVFKIASRALEIRDGLRSYDNRRVACDSEIRRLDVALAEDASADILLEMVQQARKGAEDGANAIRMVQSHLALIPGDHALRVVPFRRRRVPMPVPKVPVKVLVEKKAKPA